MPETAPPDAPALEEARDWTAYWKGRAERAEAEARRMEDTIDELKTELILRQKELLKLYRP